ncbi:hypothetical protein BRD00_02395 [Halobacteriales archaeon QS_8_69_26]|nr:MAG: hypothetical protein BRD00_02395 [Halobacteriales archaeon QS_8_69_26]
MSDGDSGTGSGPADGSGGESHGNPDPPIAPDDDEAPADPARKAQRLHAVATRMQSATSPPEVHELAVEAAVDILGFDWCGFMGVREGYFEILAVSEESPVDPGDRPLSVDQGVTGKCYRTGESTITADAQADPEATPTQDAFRAGLTVPVGDWGVFQCIASEPGFFDETDLEVGELLAAHARSALDRIEQTRRLERLYGATRRLMSAETREEVAGVASETAAAVLEFPLNAVLLHDEEAGALVPAAASDRAREVFGEAPRIGPDEGVAWRAFRDGETAVHDDVGETRGTYGAGARSELLVPLGEHGVLVLGSTVAGEFDDDDVAVAETLAANITAALDRADRERELRRNRRRLRRQNERLDRFASVVSHDLRNPLFGARGGVELASQEHDSEGLDHAVDALDRMETIIEDALTLAREGRAVDDPEPVDLASIVDECWHRIDPPGARLTVEADCRIRADPDRLRRVFENLFRNCMEHAAPGDRSGSDRDTGSGGDPTLSVRVGTLDGGFCVEDDGPGIPEDRRGDVFESGYSTEQGGTGLGLSIVEEIVEAHGWEVAATDGTDGGARFEVTGVEVLGG